MTEPPRLPFNPVLKRKISKAAQEPGKWKKIQPKLRKEQSVSHHLPRPLPLSRLQCAPNMTLPFPFNTFLQLLLWLGDIWPKSLYQSRSIREAEALDFIEDIVPSGRQLGREDKHDVGKGKNKEKSNCMSWNPQKWMGVLVGSYCVWPWWCGCPSEANAVYPWAKHTPRHGRSRRRIQRMMKQF